MSRRAVSRGHESVEPQVRRAYFECRYGQLHVHNAMPVGGGFDEATALLCIHRPGLNGRMFATLMRRAAVDRSVYAPDLPGHGESDGPPASAGIVELATALTDFLADLRLRSVDVLGAGVGSLIAIELAIANAAAVRRVVCAGLPDTAPRYRIAERLPMLTQRLLILRPRDEYWDATARAREFARGARMIDHSDHGSDFLDASADIVATELRAFLAD